MNYEIELSKSPVINNKAFGYQIKITDKKINNLAGRVDGCLVDDNWCV